MPGDGKVAVANVEATRQETQSRCGLAQDQEVEAAGEHVSPHFTEISTGVIKAKLRLTDDV